MKTENRNLLKICLTGGPCAGKTTSLSKLIETFAPKFAVYTVPELATITFSSGVTIIPSAFTADDSRKFTASIIQAQIDIEKYFENLALTQRKQVIMVTDRGCCDNFAYTSDENKIRILDENGWTMNFLCNERYDMIIHLVTAASGAEEFYTIENNSARSETKDEAVLLDHKIQKEWMGHPNFVIIDNSQKGFEKKINRVLDIVSDLTGEKAQHKIIRKYLVDPGFTIEQIPSDIKCERFVEVQTFLLTNKPKTQNFVFKRTYAGNNFPIYIYASRKIEEKYEKRIETHRIISEKFYLDCVSSQRDGQFDQTKKSIVSFSHSVGSEHNLFSVEKTSSKGETYLILKVVRDQEHTSDLFIPGWLKASTDITEVPKFFSMNFSNWNFTDDRVEFRKMSKEFDSEKKANSENEIKSSLEKIE